MRAVAGAMACGTSSSGLTSSASSSASSFIASQFSGAGPVSDRGSGTWLQLARMSLPAGSAIISTLIGAAAVNLDLFIVELWPSRGFCGTFDGGRQKAPLFGWRPQLFCGWGWHVGTFFHSSSARYTQIFFSIACTRTISPRNSVRSRMIGPNAGHLAHFGRFGEATTLAGARWRGRFCQTTGDFRFTDAVGPSHQNIFGVALHWRGSSSSCMRRQRLRNAIATERFAFIKPTNVFCSVR